MFIVTLNYIRPLSEVDRFVNEHVEFLKQQYAAGYFLLSGRQVPRIGGLIVAQAASRAEIEEIVQRDPFYREQVAEFSIVEFEASMTAPELVSYRSV